MQASTAFGGVPSSGEGLRGFLPRQSSTAPSPQTADIPSSSGSLQGSRPGQSSTGVAVQNVSTPRGEFARGARAGGD